VGEQFLLEVEEEQPHARARHRVTRHQLRVREALVDVLVDDVRFVQDEVALHQDGHLVVRVHQRDVFGLGEEVDVADLEVHALFEQHEAAAVRIGAGRSGVKHHHGVGPQSSVERAVAPKKSAVGATAPTALQARPGGKVAGPKPAADAT
jgi:hypothetical protein